MQLYKLAKCGSVLLIALTLNGCFGHSMPLDSKWWPLRELKEADWVADGMVTTIEGVAFTNKLSDLPTGLELDALLTHERVHAVDEQFYGMQFYTWYASNTGYRWDAESRAWAAEIAFKRQHGLPVDVQWYAAVAADRYAGMIDHQQALAWFQNEATK